MIKYILKCENKHEFESWFSSSSEFEKLRKKKLLECIFCKSVKVAKSIMSPSIVSKQKNSYFQHEDKKKFKKIKKDLIQMRNFIEKNFEFVGDKFSQEIKNIYYDKGKNKNIYGTTTSKQRKELKEEGIELTSIPWINKEN